MCSIFSYFEDVYCITQRNILFSLIIKDQVFLRRVGNTRDLFYQESMSPGLQREFKPADVNRDR